jgi:hypothetical protein
MLTLDECIGMSGLEEAVIDAIARHQRIPEIAAVELGAMLLASREGRCQIRWMITVRADHDTRAGNQQRATTLRGALSEFDATHFGGPIRRRPDRRRSRR